MTGCSSSNNPSSSSSSKKELEQNPDYIALSASLNLLQTQHAKASRDIVKLRELKSEALVDPEKFKDELVKTGNIKEAPKPQKIAKVPEIDWSKYKS